MLKNRVYEVSVSPVRCWAHPSVRVKGPNPLPSMNPEMTAWPRSLASKGRRIILMLSPDSAEQHAVLPPGSRELVAEIYAYVDQEYATI